MAEEATTFLEQKKEELELAIQEQEKAKKGKKKKGQEETEVNPAEYRYLPKDLLLRML